MSSLAVISARNELGHTWTRMSAEHPVRTDVVTTRISYLTYYMTNDFIADAMLHSYRTLAPRRPRSLHSRHLLVPDPSAGGRESGRPQRLGCRLPLLIEMHAAAARGVGCITPQP